MSDTLHLFGTSLSITDHVRKALVIAILNAIISVSVAVLNTPNLTTYNFAILLVQAIINAAILVRRSGAVTNSAGLLALFLIVQVGGTLVQNLPSSQPADPRVIAAALIQAATSALMLLEGEWSKQDGGQQPQK